MKTQSAAATDARVLEILDAYLAERRAGRAPDRQAILARHPDLAEALAASFRALDFVHDAGRDMESEGLPPGRTDPASGARVLGDYRLLREIARGGMAVVYEAEQVSLGRHVALKVLPFAAVLEPKQLQRFKNEAHAAAQLRHPHIVPVHAVGCDRGVHYYAMQYVEGESLAVAIRDLRERRNGARAEASDGTAPGAARAGGRTPISSHGSSREPAYLRSAARLGVQAAEALDYAHQVGIVHRDVKPGNLLVDTAGTLWVTDFGLACTRSDAGLTVTGELLGTIRYMSPEQALAKRVPVDHRTDVYSLGATLYELLTLEPAFPGDEVHVVLQDIASREPVPPRRLNPALPRDLESVVLKAMAKDPAGRYATAQEMADDLARFLENRPVEAKRPGPLRRAAKWSRRHRALVGAGVGVLLLAVAALATGSAFLWREQERTRKAFLRADGNLSLALKALDAIYLDEAEDHPKVRGGLPDDLLETGLRFYEEFARENVDSEGVARLKADALHRASSIFGRLRKREQADATLDRAISTYRELIERHPEDPSLRLRLGFMLSDGKRDMNGAVRELLRAIESRPDYAEAYYDIGHAFLTVGLHDGAIDWFRKAIRVRSDYALPYYQLGLTLRTQGDLAGAIASLRDAVRLRPKSAVGRNELGIALHEAGRHEEALREFQEATRLAPNFSDAHNSLGRAFEGMGNVNDAIAEFRAAIRCRADNGEAHANLGRVLLDQGEVDEAIRLHREALRLLPNEAYCHMDLGNALSAKKDRTGAILKYLDAVRLDPAYARAHSNLGYELAASGDFEGGVRACEKAAEIDPTFAAAHMGIGFARTRQGRFKDALEAFRKGHDLGSKRPDWPFKSRELIEEAERNVRLERRLARVDSGEVRPRDATEKLELSMLLYLKSRHGEAARMCIDAFAEAPALAEDLSRGFRYHAACSAARAAARGGEDAAEWRGQALEWLRADLAALEKEPSGHRRTLEHWKRDPDFAGVRDRIGDLPEAEREAWRGLWASVDAALTAAPTSR